MDRGYLYHRDATEEYKELMLDAIEKEHLKRQHARREKIGAITSARWD